MPRSISRPCLCVKGPVVFDEKVFPFASMHPNAGARLRAELNLLPDILLNPSNDPSNDFGGVRVNGSMSSYVPSNSSSSAGSASLPAGLIPTQDHEATSSYGAKDRGYLMCSPTGSSTRIEADRPAAAKASVGEAASGSASGRQQSSPGSPADADPVLQFGEPCVAAQTDPAAPSDANHQEDLPAGSSAAPGGSTTALTPGADRVAPPPEPRHQHGTRLHSGIVKPKVRTDGTVRWGMVSQVASEEPATVSGALHDKNWASAMQAEYDALQRNHTWRLVPRPQGKNIIDCK